MRVSAYELKCSHFCILSKVILMNLSERELEGVDSESPIIQKAFFSDQCKEIEENNRKGNARDLFKKIRDIKGTFHENMGLIKDRNGMDLTEAEDTKKMWQEYTEELYKKIFTTQIITIL